MSEKLAKERTVYLGVAQCPYCSKNIQITVKRKTLEPGKKALTKDKVVVSKAVQKSLGDSYE